jgi:8-oxo-dGTP pyrophosphatase MutT (NUDIX family)
MLGGSTPALIPAATLLVIREGIEVLMIRRPEGGFFGGLWVFPGGAVDAADHQGDDPHRRAAVREAREEVGLEVPPEELVPLSHWITPVIAPRRFDTRFYLWKLTRPGSLRAGRAEVEEVAWVVPTDALSLHRRGEWPMILPTVAHLRWLSGFDSCGEILAAAVAEPPFPDGLTPRVLMRDGVPHFLIPGDPGYDEATG